MINRHIAPGGGTAIVEVTGNSTGLTLHHAQQGDLNVVISTGSKPNILAAMKPVEAREFAQAILDAADVIDPDGSADTEYRRVMADPGARGRFREGMSIARQIYRPAR